MHKELYNVHTSPNVPDRFKSNFWLFIPGGPWREKWTRKWTPKVDPKTPQPEQDRTESGIIFNFWLCCFCLLLLIFSCRPLRTHLDLILCYFEVIWMLLGVILASFGHHIGSFDALGGIWELLGALCSIRGSSVGALESFYRFWAKVHCSLC